MIVYRGAICCRNCGRVLPRDEGTEAVCCVFEFTDGQVQIEVDLNAHIVRGRGDADPDGVDLEPSVDGRRFRLTDEELEEGALEILESQD